LTALFLPHISYPVNDVVGTYTHNAGRQIHAQPKRFARAAKLTQVGHGDYETPPQLLTSRSVNKRLLNGIVVLYSYMVICSSG